MVTINSRLIAVFGLVFLLLAAFPMVDYGTVADITKSADWIVSANETVTGETVILMENLTVKAGATLTLDDVTLIINSTYPGQHGIFVEAGASLVVNNSRFKDHFVSENEVVWMGREMVDNPPMGYFLVSEGTLTITGSTIQHMWRMGEEWPVSGIQAEAGTLEITDSTLSNNFMSAVSLDNATAKIDNVDIVSNAWDGIYSNTSDLTVTNSRINQNGWHGFSAQMSTIMVDGTNISLNGRYGMNIGGVENLQMTNSSFYKNRERAMYFGYVTATIENTTIHSNTSIVTGGETKILFDRCTIIHEESQNQTGVYTPELKNAKVTFLDLTHGELENSLPLMINTTIELAHTLDVTVLDENGTGVAGAEVKAYDSDGEPSATYTADSNGTVAGIRLTEVLVEAEYYFPTITYKTPHILVANGTSGGVPATARGGVYMDSLKSVEINLSAGPGLDIVIEADIPGEPEGYFDYESANLTEYATVNLNISNNGAVNASNVSVKAFLNALPVWETTVAKIPAGGQVQTSFQVERQNQYLDRNLLIFADPDNEISESNEENNLDNVSISPAVYKFKWEHPNTFVSSIITTPGETVKYTFAVKNTGNVKNTIDLGVSPDGETTDLSVSAWLAGAKSFTVDLWPGENRTIELTFNLPNQVNQNYNRFRITYFENGYETFNEQWLDIVMESRIEPVKLETSSGLKRGDNATFTASIKNFGVIDAENVTVSFYLGGRLIRTATIDSLPVGETEDVSVNWVPQVDGEKEFRVVVRPYARPIHGSDSDYDNSIDVSIAKSLQDEAADGGDSYLSLFLVAILGEILIVLLLLGRIRRR